MKKADLHIHTIYSDGALTPKEIVLLAKERGVDCIAITDHDSVAGIPEAVDAGKKYGVEVIPGVELKLDYGEIVALFINPCDAELQGLLDRIAVSRKDQVISSVGLLREDGYDITFEDVAKFRKGSYMGVHIAKTLVEKGYFPVERDVYYKLLFRGNKYYVKRYKPSVIDVIKIVKRAGGVAIFAHPWLDGTDYFFANFDKLLEAGLDGFEIETSEYKPDNYEEVKKKLLQLSKEHDVVLSKGSDFHSPTFGGRLGGVLCDYSVVEALKERLRNKKS